MKQRWTLHVEDFGPISKADIEIHPMMLFAGENNSGKSYMMMLLWGIITNFPTMFLMPVVLRFTSLDSYQKCEQWISEKYLQKQAVIDVHAQALFVNLFNTILDEFGKTAAFQSIIKYPINPFHVSITNYNRSEPVNIIWSEEAVDVSVVEDTIYFPKETDFKKVLFYIYTKLFFDNLSINKYISLFNTTNANKPPIYLPASRTGFVLTHKLLISNIIGNFFGNALESLMGNMSQQESKVMDIQLPDPVVLFLQNLVQVTQLKNSSYQNICNKLEKDIIRGKVKIDNSPIKNFLYQPEGSNIELPVHAISSLVTELMPLILILQSDLQYKLMIIEEPESHLHLQLQKVLTNCLIRLVNSGLAVWSTTHSDTILQQVNNMIKLYNHPGPARDQLAQEFGYEEEDYLNPADVVAYQFKVSDDGKTIVTRLELTDGGFVVPTFNETIIDLSKETLRFEELSSDDND